MSFSRTLVGGVALATAISIGLPAAATGEEPPARLVLDDPAGDVWLAPDDGPVQADDTPAADVVDAVVVHGRRNLRVNATFVDLQQVDPQDYSVGLLTPDGWRDFTVSARPGNWDGRVRLSSEGPGGPSCDSATHKIDYDTETVNIVVPRSCVGRPAWVRVAIFNYLSESMRDDSPGYWDNPHTAGSEGRNTRKLFRAPAPDSTDTPPVSRVELSDPTGDVWTNGPGFTLAPDTPGADVGRTVLAHRPHRLVLRMWFADLQPGGRQEYQTWVWTPAGTRWVQLTVSPEHPEGVVRLMRGSGRPVECRSPRYDIDTVANRIVLSVPRNCLGRPPWVRVLVSNYLVQPGDDGREVYVDNPHNAKAFPNRPSPRIYAAEAS